MPLEALQGMWAAQVAAETPEQAHTWRRQVPQRAMQGRLAVQVAAETPEQAHTWRRLARQGHLDRPACLSDYVGGGGSFQVTAGVFFGGCGGLFRDGGEVARRFPSASVMTGGPAGPSEQDACD